MSDGLDFTYFTKQHLPPDGQRDEPGIRAIFELKAVENPRKSKEQGRPIFEEREFVALHVVGDKNTVNWERVNPGHIQRWPQAYAAFKAGQKQAVIGTPLEQWPVLGVARVYELKALQIFTVEELASLTDAGIQRLGMGARELVQQAQAFLAAASGQAPIAQLAGANEELRAENAAMRQQLADLSERVARLDVERETKASAVDQMPYVDDEPEPERRGPGRPRKVA